jgi:hypothetical protein
MQCEGRLHDETQLSGVMSLALSNRLLYVLERRWRESTLGGPVISHQVVP